MWEHKQVFTLRPGTPPGLSVCCDVGVYQSTSAVSVSRLSAAKLIPTIWLV